MTSTASGCAGPSTSCPDAGPVCDPRTAIDLRNITGLEGPQICQVNIPAANWTTALATCCVGNSTDNIHVQDDCTRYCSSNLDQSDFGRCIHSFLPEGYVGYCQQASQTSDSTSNGNATNGGMYSLTALKDSEVNPDSSRRNRHKRCFQ
jgi:hypothetical protein